MMSRKELYSLLENNEKELVRLTSDLIKINSENPTGSQREIIDFVKKYLSDAGVEVQEVAASEDHPCILAEIGSDEGFSIIINGHVDVVPAGDLSQWEFDPFGGSITDTQILGRGTSDMKAGIACALFVMKLLKQSGAQLDGNVRLHIVSDEETGGKYGTKWLCQQGYAKGADACLVAEPTSRYTIEIGQKGSNELILRAYGKTAHGSLENYKGDNAILKLSKVLQNIGRLRRVEGKYTVDQQEALSNSKYIAKTKLNVPGVENVIDHVTANVATINGGNKLNMVPDFCEAHVDMRLPIGIDLRQLEHEIREMIKESRVEGVEYEADWKNFGNSTSIDSHIVQTLRKNAEDIWKIEVLPAYQWASSDANYYRKLNIPTIQYGPSNTEGIHSYNENVDIEDVINASKIYLLTICDLLGIS